MTSTPTGRRRRDHGEILDALVLVAVGASAIAEERERVRRQPMTPGPVASVGGGPPNRFRPVDARPVGAPP
jgi:hypothetical protein